MRDSKIFFEKILIIVLCFSLFNLNGCGTTKFASACSPGNDNCVIEKDSPGENASKIIAALGTAVFLGILASKAETKK